MTDPEEEEEEEGRWASVIEDANTKISVVPLPREFMCKLACLCQGAF
jgi:hypothetical protein